jgi:hypothetical protein
VTNLLGDYAVVYGLYELDDQSFDMQKFVERGQIPITDEQLRGSASIDIKVEAVRKMLDMWTDFAERCANGL